MKTIYSILVFFILTSTTAFAQQKAMQKLKDITKELTERPLKVVLLKEGNKKNDIYNEYIKSAVESELTLIEDYSFVSREEYKTLIKEKTTEFSFLIYYPKKSRTKTTTIARSPEMTVKETKTTFNEDGLVLYGFNKKGKRITTMPADICYENSCTLADYYFSIQNLQNMMFGIINSPGITKMKEVKAMIAKAQNEQQENIKKLKDMTLYVNEKSINEKLKADFKKYYKYDYKIVSFEAIETAVVENDKKIALLYENTISSADTGIPVLSFMDLKKMKGIKMSVAPVQATTQLIDLFSHEISKKDLERLKGILK